MKIAVFGATGNTGLEITKQALQRGHEVTALVRNPTKLQDLTTNPKLKIIKCNILNSDEISTHLKNQDCVLSALGSPGIHIFKITFYLDSMKSIVDAMRKTNLKRLIAVSSFYVKPDNNYPTIYKMVLRPMIGRQLDSLFEMEEWIFSKCQDLDFTIVRPPRLLDDAIRDVPEIIKPDVYYLSDESGQSQIPRANVARFMLNILEKNEYIKHAVTIDLAK